MSDLVERIFSELDDIEVSDGKCRWVDVANAQTLMKLELQKALSDFESGACAELRAQLASARKLLMRIAEHRPTMSDFPHDITHLQAFALAGLKEIFGLTDEIGDF